MVKTFQRGDIQEFGTLVKIVPMTNEVVVNAIDCFQVNGTKDMQVDAQSMLPDLSGFQLLGSEYKMNMECQKWQKKEVIGEKVNKYTMWVREVEGVTIPVHYEMRGYNSLLGSHYDHYFLTYENFSEEVPDSSVFDYYVGKSCHGWPGPGSEHIYQMEPMKEFIHNHDAHVEQGLPYTLSMNHLADYSGEEMKTLRGRLFDPELKYNGGQEFKYTEKELQDAPDTLDWRLYGAVTPVKDQSVCGSCWSFGTVGTLEGTLFLHTGQLVRLSQQALVDCSWGFGNNGCDGGEDFRAYQWMLKHGGIPTEDSYGPYLGQDGYCNLNQSSVGLKIKGFVNVTSGDVDALKVAIASKGPISVAIDASHKSLSFYSSGVYFEKDCRSDMEGLDHAVLAVGYGTIAGQDYWLIKNSWSTYWGNDGYVLMARRGNNCGVATTPTYVIPAI
ncbi:digestive cysteine proteinase 1 [Eurytemora carolleeae]|uniref:digestive cysteine proteinase 1 n=1 Tax=Eurytemora carolleeae TaxID=1294199 RepID=UPI000C765C26|nr:digestive cysteine proteinase 1 [Eurytemora carolleeae]|eukprot:XP_023327352.1 digestive cysteine proteinase 1-like [Eurytemora affinis]